VGRETVRLESAIDAGAVASPEGAAAEDELRTERTIALVRMAVVAVVAFVYLSSLGVARRLGPLALTILALAAIYTLWTVLARPYESAIGRRFRTASLLADVALISLWTRATGGPASEFWTLYLIAVIAVALRFDLLETLGAAMGIALVYVVSMSAVGGMPTSSVIARPSLMVITGFAVGMLAQQRRVHDDERRALERVVEERSHALAEEQAAVARLTELDVAKTEFVAVASHEFRTPLSAIIGVLSTLRAHGDALEPAVRLELLEGAEQQASRLARLVDDLLTVSRIEAGSVALDIQPVHPDRLAFEATRASGTTSVLRVESNGVERVWCDADRMVRVVTNLLDNARKYSPPGAPILLAFDEDGDVVTIRVQDRGPGVHAEDRERIFDRFQRLVSGAGETGTGLGLYITKTLVDAHGGSISVQEAHDGGAVFEVRLPIPAVVHLRRTARSARGVSDVTAGHRPAP
jgi:signal transduction histidine kinase